VDMNPSDKAKGYEIKKQTLVDAFKKKISEKDLGKNPFSLNKKTSNLFRTRKNNHSNSLNVKTLNQVIHIDPVNLIAEVEGMTTYETLVEETLKYGLLPPVAPELKTITVGGALVGLGIESSSFRYGLVHETILEIEVLTGNGDVLICNKDNEYKDLFYAFPNSYGTLGYALKIKMQLILAKKFVKLTNLRFNDINTYFEKLNELCQRKQAQYIDGVIFKKNEMFIILGEFVDEAPFVNNYTYMNIYYKSIQKQKINYLSTHDYIWRWDTDWFWCSKHFGMNQPFLRFLFGKWMLHSAVYWKISHFISSHPLINFFFRKISKPSESVIQDILIPVHNAVNFYDFFQNSVRITPIWICPFQFTISENRYPLLKLDPSTLYIDFGFWDFVPSNKPPGFINRLIEHKTEELNGFKSLYSDSFYTEEEFWKIHPKSCFSQIKSKYDPKRSFKDLFEKCVRKK